LFNCVSRHIFVISVFIGMVFIRNCRRAYPATFEKFHHDFAKGVGHAPGLVINLHPNLDHYWRSFISLDLEKSWYSLQNGKSGFLKAACMAHIMLRDLLTQKCLQKTTVTDFRYPRACRFRKTKQTYQFSPLNKLFSKCDLWQKLTIFF
jgi:hypothetical protein